MIREIRGAERGTRKESKGQINLIDNWECDPRKVASSGFSRFQEQYQRSLSRRVFY